MRPIVTDRVAWSVYVGLLVCRSRLGRAKTAEPIEMPFGVWTRVDPRNRAIR